MVILSTSAYDVLTYTQCSAASSRTDQHKALRQASEGEVLTPVTEGAEAASRREGEMPEGQVARTELRLARAGFFG